MQKAVRQEWGAALFVGTVIVGIVLVGLIFLIKSASGPQTSSAVVPTPAAHASASPAMKASPAASATGIPSTPSPS
ncbi:MAG: hypothetical protein ACP5OR_01850 [Candidatus Dormibacteria bacterium]